MPSSPARINFVSLGCAKNTVDSEVMLGRLATEGFVVCARPEDADVVVVNTCGFLQAAEAEALETIRGAVRLKDRGRVRAVVVAGCLPSRYGTAAEEKLDGVDAILGVPERDRIAEVCRQILADRGFDGRVLNLTSRNYPEYEIDRDRLRITPRHTAYLRVAEGCNHTCAFCIIPHIRGRFRSKPMEELVREARELAADGAVELNLIGQDVSEYGLDLYRRTMLHELLPRLADIDGVRWIRCLYMYPTMVTDAMIREIARNPKVVKYIDMPIQHTRDRMLRLMRRGLKPGQQDELIRKIRAEIPGVVFRTTVIAGHPGETIEDHEAMLEDLERYRFERLGAFVFSVEPGTRAASMPDAVPEKEGVRRRDAIMRRQRRIAAEIHKTWVGREIEAIVEGSRGRGLWIGRTAADAPDVDGSILLRGETAAGRIVRARITAARGYDLAGVVTEP